MRYKQDLHSFDLDFPSFTFYGAVLRTDDYDSMPRGYAQFRHMNAQAFIRHFIRRYGEINTVLVFTAALIALVTGVIAGLDWLRYRSVDTSSLSVPIIL